MKHLALTLLLLLCSCSKIKDLLNDSNDPKPPTNPPVSTPDTRLGLAPYALLSPNFNCEAFISSLSPLKSYNLSILWNTFGNDQACLNRIFQDKRLKGIQVHLINEVCVRNRNCGSYEAYYDLTPAKVTEHARKSTGWFKQRVIVHAQALSNYLTPHLQARTDIDCYISPGLESNTPPDAMGNIISWIKPYFPMCSIVYNPLNLVPLPPQAQVIENHNPYTPAIPGPCIFNNDGVSFDFPSSTSSFPRRLPHTDIPSIYARYKSCEAVFFWHHSYNCIVPGTPFKDPRHRTCSDSSPFSLLSTAVSNVVE